MPLCANRMMCADKLSLKDFALAVSLCLVGCPKGNSYSNIRKLIMKARLH